jgi:hypothetical protein
LESARPLRERFDLIIGTSIGGIIACGLAVGIPAEGILAAIDTHCPQIFDRRPSVFGRRVPVRVPRYGILGTRYSAHGLQEAIRAVLNVHTQTKLNDVKAPLMVVAVNRTQVRPRIFRSAGVPNVREDPASLLDVALSTSAAPTFFPEHQIGTDNMIDGGIIANAPDLIGLSEMMAVHLATPDMFEMLSIGTVGSHRTDIYRAVGSYGSIGWMLRRKLFEVTISAQERLSTQVCASLLRSQYVRIDYEPSRAQQAVLGLDQAGERAAQTLKSIADATWTNLSSAEMQKIRAMMRHTAEWIR